MANYAFVQNGLVTDVIVAEQDFIDQITQNNTSRNGTGEWIQTSYNTRGGQHTLGGRALRKNFAGIGYTYDAGRDAFIAPRPYSNWILDEETCLWIAPIPYPTDGRVYTWNVFSENWVEWPYYV